MKVLITGITGMVGSHLAEYIVEEKLGEVYGLAGDGGVLLII